jgi:hypothetical protein
VSLHVLMNLLLIRFAVIAAGIALLTIVGFTAAMLLRRAGRLDQASRIVGRAATAYLERAADQRRSRR